jgi:hypothetical protein
VPYILTCLLRAIEDLGGLDCEGIFRLSGKQTEEENLINRCTLTTTIPPLYLLIMIIIIIIMMMIIILIICYKLTRSPLRTG